MKESKFFSRITDRQKNREADLQTKKRQPDIYTPLQSSFAIKNLLGDADGGTYDTDTQTGLIV